jgi:hypothetical protein
MPRLELKGQVMTKKLEELRRLVNKLTAKYGSRDDAIIRLQRELDALEAFESMHPSSYYLSAPHYDFRTRAKRLYLASENRTPNDLSH